MFDHYRAGLTQGRNHFRWVEYSLSGSPIVIIAQLVGISDVVALLALFGVNASMILFGWLQEVPPAGAQRVAALHLRLLRRGRAVGRGGALHDRAGVDDRG